ncbi:carboxylating nicotinate-nucleotide diphosphorylase [bacterium]|nr:carboxylating nicotinate-nucleotide diphosphorylase [candidate division CSSED10-310 bacterium]
MKPWTNPIFLDLLRIALMEDLLYGDATTEAVIADDANCRARIVSKSECVIAGQNVAQAVFHEVDRKTQYHAVIEDGCHASPGTEIATVQGNCRTILAGERIALNFFQRMSGIATMTRDIRKMIAHTECRIVDTRKTLPGHRILDKYAVRMGGGSNHRMGLGDGILIKDNHVDAAGGVAPAVHLARLRARHPLRIQVEVRNRDEAMAAVEAGAEALLLDNMQPAQVKDIVAGLKDSVFLECSGTISHQNVIAYAETGIHMISIGALTHSVKAADISLQFER